MSSWKLHKQYTYVFHLCLSFPWHSSYIHCPNFGQFFVPSLDDQHQLRTTAWYRYELAHSREFLDHGFFSNVRHILSCQVSVPFCAKKWMRWELVSNRRWTYALLNFANKLWLECLYYLVIYLVLYSLK